MARPPDRVDGVHAALRLGQGPGSRTTTTVSGPSPSMRGRRDGGSGPVLAPARSSRRRLRTRPAGLPAISPAETAEKLCPSSRRSVTFSLSSTVNERSCAIPGASSHSLLTCTEGEPAVERPFQGDGRPLPRQPCPGRWGPAVHPQTARARAAPVNAAPKPATTLAAAKNRAPDAEALDAVEDARPGESRLVGAVGDLAGERPVGEGVVLPDEDRHPRGGAVQSGHRCLQEITRRVTVAAAHTAARAASTVTARWTRAVRAWPASTRCRVSTA